MALCTHLTREVVLDDRTLDPVPVIRFAPVQLANDVQTMSYRRRCDVDTTLLTGCVPTGRESGPEFYWHRSKT